MFLNRESEIEFRSVGIDRGGVEGGEGLDSESRELGRLEVVVDIERGAVVISNGEYSRQREDRRESEDRQGERGE